MMAQNSLSSPVGSNVGSTVSGPAHTTTLAVRTEESSARGGAESVSSSPEREVDYYLNPTELFRWINYRRWDGAKSRVLSNPEETQIWIVSRHSSDGRILWRHLPLHLVCMQSGGGQNDKNADPNGASAAAQQREVEELIDVLLDAYPDGASSPDDQGMLPLHLCIANSTLPSERILNLLLIANPKAVETKDKYGRTPFDILHEKNVGGARYEAAIRAMKRAQHMTSRLTADLKEESSRVVSSITEEAANERKASQRIILRLEEELNGVRQKTDDVENIHREEQGVRKDLENQIRSLQEKLNRSSGDLNHVREERDDLKSRNDTLKTQVDEHDQIIAELHRNFERENEHQVDEIASLKSEVSTARAMAEALESQLRSRFTNEEYLSTTVGDLESNMNKLKSQFDKERKQLLHEKESLINEKEQLHKTVEDLTSRNITMQTKVSELSKQMSNILSNHSALNAEHDRMIDAASRHESELVDAVRNEREQVLGGLQKHRELLDNALAEQQRAIEESSRKEIEMIEEAKEQRARGTDIIERLRQDFKEARALALERERKIHAENISVKNRQMVTSQTKSQYRVGAAGSAGGASKRDEIASSAGVSKESAPSSKQSHRMMASRGDRASPATLERSPMKYPRSPSLASQDSDAASTVTSPSTNQVYHNRHQQIPRLTIKTDQRQAPDGHLLRLLDDRAEKGNGHASRSTRAPSSQETSTDSGMVTPRRSGVVEKQSSNGSSSRSSRSTRERGHQAYGGTAQDSQHGDAQHSVKFAPASWGGSAASASAAQDTAHATSWSRTKSSPPQHTSSSNRRRESPESVSLEEYSQASSAEFSADSTSKGAGSYRQFSGMNQGIKNRLIRVGDQQYGRGKVSGVVDDDRNDLSVGESTHSSGYSR